jgi:hypothetical protein
MADCRFPWIELFKASLWIEFSASLKAPRSKAVSLRMAFAVLPRSCTDLVPPVDGFCKSLTAGWLGVGTYPQAWYNSRI